MGKMFQTIDDTWNPFTGCNFQCCFCWARKLALTRLSGVERYKEGFVPYVVWKDMRKGFRAGEFVAVSLMGDISFCPHEALTAIMENIIRQPEVKFLFCTKDPSVYSRWHLPFPNNLYLGTTIESNIDHGVSKAPAPVARYEAMVELEHPHKFISIEPLMDFHLATLVKWIKEIGPEIIEVGPDNYHNSLPEPVGASGRFPAPWKVRWLLEMLRDFCPTVVEKPGLSRLLSIS